MPTLLMYLGMVLAGFGSGWYVAHLQGDHSIAQLRQQIDARAQAQQQAIIKLQQQAQAKQQAYEAAADAALTKAQSRADAANRQALELTHEVEALTTGRTCLDARVVRVLNGSPAASADRTAPNVPAPAKQPAAAASAPAANPNVATDRDIVGWVIQVRAMYETCRARIDALRQWNESTTP